MYFVDTSALVKAYVEADSTETARQALDLLGGSLYLSRLIVMETFGAFAKLMRLGKITRSEYEQARNDFLAHEQRLFHDVPLSDPVSQLSIAIILAESDHRCGPNDLIHIATAEHLQALAPEKPVVLISCDDPQKKAANGRGLEVFDPAKDPLSSLVPPS